MSTVSRAFEGPNDIVVSSAESCCCRGRGRHRRCSLARCLAGWLLSHHTRSRPPSATARGPRGLSFCLSSFSPSVCARFHRKTQVHTQEASLACVCVLWGSDISRYRLTAAGDSASWPCTPASQRATERSSRRWSSRQTGNKNTATPSPKKNQLCCESSRAAVDTAETTSAANNHIGAWSDRLQHLQGRATMCVCSC